MGWKKPPTSKLQACKKFGGIYTSFLTLLKWRKRRSPSDPPLSGEWTSTPHDFCRRKNSSNVSCWSCFSEVSRYGCTSRCNSEELLGGHLENDQPFKVAKNQPKKPWNSMTSEIACDSQWCGILRRGPMEKILHFAGAQSILEIPAKNASSWIFTVMTKESCFQT